MTNLREAAQMALDALMGARGYIYHNVLDDKTNKYDTAMEALRARLAQPDLITPADVKQLARIEKLVEDVDPYTTPPQREWQGLTDEEIADAVKAADAPEMVTEEEFLFIACRATEAALKEKNA